MLKGRMKNNLIRVRRYIIFLFQYFVCEKPHGLDFTMRDKRLIRDNAGIYHGYSKTDEKHLREIFKRLSYEESMKLLDVGAGKGVVLKEAAKFPFTKIAGIELQDELVQIANNNFRILKLENRVQCIQANALEYDGYHNYNVFFFFNPFSEEILEAVVGKIIESRNEANCIITIIYHNPSFIDVFKNKAYIMTEEMLHDDMKNYDTYILKLDLAMHLADEQKRGN